MADLDAIRQGLAANLVALKTAGVVNQVSGYLLDSPSPPSICVAGVDEIAYDTTFHRGGDSWTFLIEACLPLVSDIGGQKILHQLLDSTGSTSVKTAVETDRALTSRLSDAGTVTTGQTAACADLRVTEYRGQSRFLLPGRTEVLLAVWAVQVET